MSSGLSFEDAIVLNSGVLVSGQTISHRDNTRHFYKFNVKKDDVVVVWVENASYPGTNLALLDENNNTLVFMGNRNEGLYPLLTTRSTYEGIMYLTIASMNYSTSVDYSLKVEISEYVYFAGETKEHAIEVPLNVDMELKTTFQEYYRYLKFNCEVGKFYTFRSFNDHLSGAILYDENSENENDYLERYYESDGEDGEYVEDLLICHFMATTPVMYLKYQRNSKVEKTNTIRLSMYEGENLIVEPEQMLLRIDDYGNNFYLDIKPSMLGFINYHWSISDENIATIDEYGYVTPVSIGTTTATVLVETEYGGPFTATYTINVVSNSGGGGGDGGGGGYSTMRCIKMKSITIVVSD